MARLVLTDGALTTHSLESLAAGGDGARAAAGGLAGNEFGVAQQVDSHGKGLFIGRAANGVENADIVLGLWFVHKER